MAETMKKQQLSFQGYTGVRQPTPSERDRFNRPLYPYFPDQSLVEAVNLSIYLKRPLLLKGEPGCGKTRLAHAVAYELGLPYEAWHIKSTSRARDGLYTYDAVRRLRDAQLAAAGRLKEEDSSGTDDIMRYVKLGPLGRAFKEQRRTVVLIDEIDKADIDFPNDLLYELDELTFEIEELGVRIDANHPPIVFITSNDEKDLPDAFLRRCLFHYVEFPSRRQLMDIINARFAVYQPDSRVMEAAVNRFLELREDMGKQKGDSGKRVSTSELIDWFDVLRRYPSDNMLAQLRGILPYPSILLKSWDDHRQFISRTQTEIEK